MINKKMSIAETVAENQVWAYFILTLAIGLAVSGFIYATKIDIYGSAFGILVYLIYMLCPAIVAIVLLAVFDGKNGITSLLDSLFRWKVGPQWYALAILLPIAIEVLTMGAYLAINGKLPLGYSFSFMPWNLALDILISSVGLALGFGFALPLLQKTYSPALSTAIMALFLILYRAVALASDPNVVIMCAGLIAIAFVLVWMYNNARNSLLIVTLFLFLYSLMFNLITYQLSIYSGSGVPVYINKILLIVGIIAAYFVFRYFSLDEP